MSTDPALWNQFRRLLLGTVVEALLEERVAVDFGSIRIDFHDDSAFRVPRFNNYMRFRGHLTAALAAAVEAATQQRLHRRLDDVWPEILQVVNVPIGDRLTEERNHLLVEVRQAKDVLHGRLFVGFDLEAD